MNSYTVPIIVAVIPYVLESFHASEMSVTLLKITLTPSIRGLCFKTRNFECCVHYAHRLQSIDIQIRQCNTIVSIDTTTFLFSKRGSTSAWCVMDCSITFVVVLLACPISLLPILSFITLEGWWTFRVLNLSQSLYEGNVGMRNFINFTDDRMISAGRPRYVAAIGGCVQVHGYPRSLFCTVSLTVLLSRLSLPRRLSPF